MKESMPKLTPTYKWITGLTLLRAPADDSRLEAYLPRLSTIGERDRDDEHCEGWQHIGSHAGSFRFSPSVRAQYS